MPVMIISKERYDFDTSLKSMDLNSFTCALTVGTSLSTIAKAEDTNPLITL